MFGSIGMPELIIILVIALIIFGAKRLRNVGSDLGAAVRGFKKEMNRNDEDEDDENEDRPRKRLKHQDADDAQFDEEIERRPSRTQRDRDA